MKIVGNKIYDVCWNCGEIVQINKFLIGSMHICLSSEEIKAGESQLNRNKYFLNKKRLRSAE